MKRVNSALARLRRERTGVVAVEFAMILPVMLTFYLGIYEGANAIVTKRKVDSAAETVGGIVARSSQMDATRMANAMLISTAIVGASNSAALTLTITAVKVDAAGKATVDWSRKNQSAGLTAGAKYTLPQDLQPFTDAYFVLTTASYDYKPMFGYGGLIKTMRFERTFSFRPRRGSDIPWS